MMRIRLPDNAFLGDDIRARWPSAKMHSVGEGTRVSLFSLFRLDLRPVGSGAVAARLAGWDRDLSHLMQPRSGPIPLVLDEAMRVIDALAPAALRHPHLSLTRRARTQPDMTWEQRRQAALDARTLRELGVDPLDRIDAARLRGLIDDQWPGAAVSRTDPSDDSTVFSLRPTATFVVRFVLDRRGNVEVDIDAPGGVADVFGRSPGSDGRPAQTADVLAKVDAWLRATMPASWLLDLPILPEKELTRD